MSRQPAPTKTTMRNKTFLLAVLMLSGPVSVPAQSVPFDFDNVAAHTPLPIVVTVDGITARLSFQYYGYSIQRADTMGFTPLLFSGNCVYPNTIYRDDLYVDFTPSVSEFSILYTPQELACSTTATMRVTAYLDSTLVGTSTAQAPGPGTWPTGHLAFSSAAPFNRVVVHYDAPPPSGGDFGVIFLADNMAVSPFGGATTETLAPTSQVVNLGKIDGGDLGSLAAQDGDFETICKFIVPSLVSPFVKLTLNYTTTKAAPTRIEFFTTARMGNNGLFSIRLLMANQQYGGFDEVMHPTRIADQFQYGIGSYTWNASEYVGAGGAVQSQIEVRQTGPSAVMRPCVEFDLAVMKVSG